MSLDHKIDQLHRDSLDKKCPRCGTIISIESKSMNCPRCHGKDGADLIDIHIEQANEHYARKKSGLIFLGITVALLVVLGISFL